MNEIKILHSEYISKHQYFTARKDKYETTSGKIVNEYFVVEMPDCACAVAITENGLVILIEQYRHAIAQNVIEIPGGFIEQNEAMDIAIARELEEETGYTFDKFIYMGKTYSNPGVLNNATHLYLATGGVKTTLQTLDSNEEITIYLKTIDEVKQLIKDNAIKQSLHELALIKAFALLNI